MKFIETIMPGCFEIEPRVLNDLRGRFVKTFHKDLFAEQGLQSVWKEEYFSVSTKGVLRGMHFQLPPHDHEKMVYCIDGEIFDVLIDLRMSSPTYGQGVGFNLSSEKANILYIPKGIAHGFYVLSNSATIVCKTGTVYAVEHDKGVSWKSTDIWGEIDPILSEKDQSLPLLRDFISPF